MKTKIILTVCLAGFLVAGCAQQTRNIDMINDEGKAVLALDYRDFDRAASLLVQSMLKGGALNKEGGGRYVMATGRIVNALVTGPRSRDFICAEHRPIPAVW